VFATSKDSLLAMVPIATNQSIFLMVAFQTTLQMIYHINANTLKVNLDIFYIFSEFRYIHVA
jgi:hydroxypyruvate isomerase